MIYAIVLAAGESKRMGQPKMLMPWGQTTVIGKVVTTLTEAGLGNIIVVTGGSHMDVDNALKKFKVEITYNKDYTNGEMLTSVQVGLTALDKSAHAALIALGDQPQIELQVVHAILNRYRNSRKQIIVPSYRMHRGHPWIIDQALWQEILTLNPPQTLRDFLGKHSNIIDYVDVDTPSVIQDLDTQSDYSQYKP
jgi:molybdenum cofactor cytidylyltransferase